MPSEPCRAAAEIHCMEKEKPFLEHHFGVVCAGESQTIAFCAVVISTWCFRRNLWFGVHEGTIVCVVCEIPGGKCKVH